MAIWVGNVLASSFQPLHVNYLGNFWKSWCTAWGKPIICSVRPRPGVQGSLGNSILQPIWRNWLNGMRSKDPEEIVGRKAMWRRPWRDEHRLMLSRQLMETTAVITLVTRASCGDRMLLKRLHEWHHYNEPLKRDSEQIMVCWTLEKIYKGES